MNMFLKTLIYKKRFDEVHKIPSLKYLIRNNYVLIHFIRH